jgi:thiamine-phosphate pyrophosphorylase
VAEELARLVLEDARLQRAIQAARHSLARAETSLSADRLLRSRAAAQDPGARSRLRLEAGRTGFLDLARANFRRAEEALRVLEEVAKLRSVPASGKFKKIRFQIYDLERDLHRKLERSFAGRHVAR